MPGCVSGMKETRAPYSTPGLLAENAKPVRKPVFGAGLGKVAYVLYVPSATLTLTTSLVVAKPAYGTPF